MQVGIVPQIKDGPAILTKVLTLLEASRRAGIRTIFTRHMSLPPELMGGFQYRMAMAWQRKQDPAEVSSPFLRDSPAFQLVPELRPLPSEAIFDKLAMSAFEGTPLQFTLRDCGIRSLILAGIALEVGIEPTCRHAADLGIIPILVRDAKLPGRIINISSVHEDMVFPNFSTYCVSKGGMRMLMRDLAVELGPLNITINDIAPGAIATPINTKMMANKTQLDALLKNIPLGRMGTPEDVAGLALFLASDDGAYCTGSTFIIDGGLIRNYHEQ